MTLLYTIYDPLLCSMTLNFSRFDQKMVHPQNRGKCSTHCVCDFPWFWAKSIFWKKTCYWEFFFFNLGFSKGYLLFNFSIFRLKISESIYRWKEAFKLIFLLHTFIFTGKWSPEEFLAQMLPQATRKRKKLKNIFLIFINFFRFFVNFD